MSIEEKRKQRTKESNSNNKKKIMNFMYLFIAIMVIIFGYYTYVSITTSPCSCSDKYVEDSIDEFLDDCADTFKYRYAIYDYQTEYFGKSTRGYIVPTVAGEYFYKLCEQSK
jgi:hypothetical protein